MAADNSELTDEALMVRYQRGDRQAFVALVRRYQTAVYNFALRRLQQPVAAEEVTQETLLRVVQKASEFKHEARFATWLYTIARNLCVDHFRRQKHRRHASLDAPSGTAGVALTDKIADAHPRASVERGVISSSMTDRIVEAVEALPDDQREVFLLRHIAGLPFKEIAVATGARENTVKSRMRYALERLQLALADFEEYARALR